MRISVPILLACLTLCLAGCGDRPDTDSTGVVPYTGSTPPTNLLAPSNVAPGPASDPVVKSGNTLASGGHSLDAGGGLSSGGDPVAQSHGLTSEDDPLLGRQSGVRRVGWYWLRGTIDNGSVSVALNGVPCGSYTDFTDREMTRYVVPGMNHVTFTSTPTSRMRPMAAHLILYMRAASADVHQTVPAATYTLTAPSFSTATATVGDSTRAISSQPSPDASGPNPSGPMDTKPVALSSPLPPVAAPQTREMTFFAK